MSPRDHGTAASRRIAEPEPDKSFDTIYRAEAPWLVRFFRRRLGSVDDAQDLAHETMVRFIRAAPTTNIAATQHYLRRIAVNLLRDRAKSDAERLAHGSVPLIESIDEEAGFDQHRVLAGHQELQRWEQILSRLKPKTLEIFLLSRVDGFTYTEIASRLGMTVWNIKKHMIKAIAHVERHRRLR